MRQRTVDLTDPQISRLTFEASRRGISVPELLRRLVDQGLDAMGTPWPEHPESTCRAPGEHLGGGDIGEGETTLQKPQLLQVAEQPRRKSKSGRLPRVSSPPGGQLLPFSDEWQPADPHPRVIGGIDRQELRWRIAEVWQAHLAAWRAFLRDKTGVEPRHEPVLHRDDIEAPIRAALLEHDRQRLGAADRERWRDESPVLAAGVGIFYDPWCSGSDPQNDVATGGKRFIEHWRPWKRLRGKPDPVIKFSDLCFEVRAALAARAR